MPSLGSLLLILVFACIVFAVFADGATAIHDESKVQVALALGIALAGVGLYAGTLGAARSTLAWAGTAMLAAFGVFCALSVIWSVAPDLSWVAANRAAEYTALVAVLLIAVPSVKRAPELALMAFLGLALLVAAYALGGKVLPGVSVGPIDLDQASRFARLRAPLGYWNSLGLLLVMATPICVWMAADRKRPAGLRIASLIALQVLALTIALTYSRGAVLAAVAALAVSIAAGPDRLRRLGVVGLGLAAAAPPVAYAFSNKLLSSDGVAASQRVSEGLLLLGLLVASAGVLTGIAVVVLRAERRARWSAGRERGFWRLLAFISVATVLAGAVALAGSQRGLSGSVEHQWDEFRKPTLVANTDPGRLVSGNGSNRWVWWREAAGEFSDRPIAGWGAGSFPILHNTYREYDTQVRSAHSVPLQFLAEGGLLGATLALGAIALLFAAAIGTIRDAEGRDRSARVALLAAAAAWAVHSFIDWDWEIPAVTLPALAALAIAATPPGAGRGWTFPTLGRTTSGRRLRPRVQRGPLAAPIAAAAVLVGLAFAASALLPAVAEDKRLAALREAGDAGQDKPRLEKALDDAQLAHRLNPLSTEALFAQALIDIRLGDFRAANDALFDAARIEPDNFRVWDGLLGLSFRVADPELGALAARRRIATEPLSFATNRVLGSGVFYTYEVPPQLSPTSYGTPAEVAPPAAAPPP